MKLSIIGRGRNDNYGSHYIERTNFCLRKHILNFQSLGLTPNDVEIVFVDWGSVIPLYTKLTQNCYGFVRYIVVPPEIARNYDPVETGFNFVHNINLGIRRCLGEYILHFDFDSFIYQNSMLNLWSYINQNDAQNYQNYFSRFCINQESYIHKLLTPNIEELKDGLYHKLGLLQIDNPGVFYGGSIGVMCSRKAWFDVGGYDERYIYWGNQDVDLFTRFYNYGLPGKDLWKTNNIIFVHLEHDHHKLHGRYDNSNLNLNYRNPDRGINPNGPNWGLSDQIFEEVIL